MFARGTAGTGKGLYMTNNNSNSKVTDSDRVIKRAALKAIKAKLSSEDADSFDKFRSSLLAFGAERSYEENKGYIAKILSYPASLQSDITKFFDSIDLGDRFKIAITKAHNKSHIPSLLKGLTDFPSISLPFISKTSQDINCDSITKNIDAYVCTIDTMNTSSIDIASVLKNAYNNLSLSPKYLEHLCIITLTADKEVFDVNMLDTAIRRFRKGRNYKTDFKNIYFLFSNNRRTQYFTLDEYCEMDGFKKRNLEKRNQRLQKQNSQLNTSIK